MKRQYRLHELENTEFEDLVCRICIRILGVGVIGFAAGRDGGRDARFEGTAERFPSAAEPAAGKFIIQAKHTSQPAASCSHSSFTRIFEEELPKVEKLAADGELDHYLLFTNRGVTAGVEAKLVKRLKAINGVKDAWILGDDPIRQRLDMHPDVWTSMGFDRYESPFRIEPQDITEVVAAFHSILADGGSPYDSATNFDYVEKERKNRVNRLTKEYFTYMQEESLRHFARIKIFLEDPRHAETRDLYHDAADELRAKIVTYRSLFDTFDEVLTAVHDRIVRENPGVRGRKRLVRTFLHYMYFDCDIGDHAPANQTS